MTSDFFQLNPCTRQDGSAVYNCCWYSPAQSFSGPSPDFTVSYSRPPNLKGHVPVFIPDRSWVARLYPQPLGSLFASSYDSQGYGAGIRIRLHTGLHKLEHTRASRREAVLAPSTAKGSARPANRKTASPATSGGTSRWRRSPKRIRISARRRPGNARRADL
jgi:hypothetical protein